MKTTFGGDRLGSGKKQIVSDVNYERSSHDLSEFWRSSMSSGTLVPFMSLIGLPGDTFDIDLNAEVITLPTIGPLFGSYKVQLDVFQVPIRLYCPKLHMNQTKIGLNMDKVFLPQISLATGGQTEQDYNEANNQVNTSALMRYLGVSGIASLQADAVNPVLVRRDFNGVPLLSYWDIFKNYYSNKQEEDAYVIHTGLQDIVDSLTVQNARISVTGEGVRETYPVLDNPTLLDITSDQYSLFSLGIRFPEGAPEPDPASIKLDLGVDGAVFVSDVFDLDYVYWNRSGTGIGRSEEWTLVCSSDGWLGSPGPQTWNVPSQTVLPTGEYDGGINLKAFPLSNIDKMKELIMSNILNPAPFQIADSGLSPYIDMLEEWGEDDAKNFSLTKSQEGLAVKTYQSDIFNNWLDTEFIDGANGVNEISKVSTVGDEFTIDALNLAKKVYKMLNRVAMSDGTYDSWLDAIYTHERERAMESPVYMGGLIKELSFEEVISNAETSDQPLGTLAGRGRLTQKHKGGKVVIKVSEPVYIMGIVSITPRLDYSQGNTFDMGLKTFDDFHKPGLDAIGFQDLITEQMLYSDTGYSNGGFTQFSLGKQVSWLNYMTGYNKCFGNFADPNKEMFMTLNRRYEIDEDHPFYPGKLKDGTTYIDPVKFNQIFAETKLDSQNFWVHIAKKITARRKMSAKQIPNL